MAINATAVWRVRPSGNNANGGGYDAGISGATTDYSRQNAAQASGSNGTATGTTTFIDATANAFTALMIGNAIWIASGAGFTVGAYFVTAFTSASTVTLDRSPGTGTVAVWKLGGGWADWWTNAGNTVSAPVAGNTVFILGSGTPNPASYTYDYNLSVSATLAAGSTTAFILFANDPSTPGYKAPPNTTGGMPVTQVTAGNGLAQQNSFTIFEGLYFVAVNASTNGLSQAGSAVYFGCVCDQLGADVAFINNIGSVNVMGCEVFSSVGAATGSRYGIGGLGFTPYIVLGCNIHDCIGGGIETGANGAVISGNIIAKCQGNGITFDLGVSPPVVSNNTIDGCLGHGILVSATVYKAHIYNNIISNNTQAGKFGLDVTGALSGIIDYNVYYNNTSDVNGISYGPHDMHGGSNPYVDQSTENYTLA